MRRSPIKRKGPRKSDTIARLAAIAEYGELCMRCGGQGHDVHHIHGRRNERTRDSMLNLMILCTDCHAWWHEKSTKQERMAWLEQEWPEHYNAYYSEKKKKPKES